MKIDGAPTIAVDITIRLTESEARALDALAGYGVDSFLEVFYKLGRAYMEPHEGGLRSLFCAIRGHGGIPGVLSRIDDARAVFDGRKIAAHKPPGGPS